MTVKPLIELGVGEHFQRSPHGVGHEVHLIAEQGILLSLEIVLNTPKYSVSQASEIVLITPSKYSVSQASELSHL